MREGAPEILVIENDARILELLARFLERRGYVVRSAVSLAEAHRSLVTDRPDLVISDLLVGSSSAAKRLAQWDREELLPPTFVVSGCLDEETERELHALRPVVGTLRKPFRFEELEQRVAEALAIGTRATAPSEGSAVSTESALPS